jgi:hypothetical protein
VAAVNPVLLEDVLVRHPKLRLFVENAGYPYRDEMIAMMYQYPQLHADVSTITWVIPREAFYDYLEAFVRRSASFLTHSRHEVPSRASGMAGPPAAFYSHDKGSRAGTRAPHGSPVMMRTSAQLVWQRTDATVLRT